MTDSASDPGLDVQFDRSGSHLTVYLAGEIDLSSGPDLAKQVIRRADPSVKELWLDLSAVTYCDSAGLSAFIAIDRHVSERGDLAVLYQPRGTVSRVLAVSGMDTVIRVIGRRSDEVEVAPAPVVTA